MSRESARPRRGAKRMLAIWVAAVAVASAVPRGAGADAGAEQMGARARLRECTRISAVQMSGSAGIRACLTGVAADAPAVSPPAPPLAMDQQAVSPPAPALPGMPCAETPAERCPAWVARYHGESPDSVDGGTSVASARVGGRDLAFVAAATNSDERGYDYLLLAYDEGGTPVWQTRFDSGGVIRNDAPAAITANGSVVVVTGVGGPATDDPSSEDEGDVLTVAFDATDGDLLWSARRGGHGRALDLGLSVQLSADGDAVYVGAVLSNTYFLDTAGVFAYRVEDGQPLWQYEQPESMPGIIYGTAVSQSGRIYAYGSVVVMKYDEDGDPLGEDLDSFIAAIEPDGRVAWERTRDARFDESVMGLAVHGDRVFAALISIDWDVATLVVPPVSETLGIELNARDGSIRWMTAAAEGCGRVCAPGHISFAPEQNVVVISGVTTPDQVALDVDTFTVAFDAAGGARKWTDVFTTHGPRMELPWTLATTATGALVGGVTAPSLAPGVAVGQPGGTWVGVQAPTYASYMALEYDLQTGELVWSSVYNSAATGTDVDRVFGGATSPDGDMFFLTGVFYPQTSPDDPMNENRADVGTVAYETGSRS